MTSWSWISFCICASFSSVTGTAAVWWVHLFSLVSSSVLLNFQKKKKRVRKLLAIWNSLQHYSNNINRSIFSLRYESRPTSQSYYWSFTKAGPKYKEFGKGQQSFTLPPLVFCIWTRRLQWNSLGNMPQRQNLTLKKASKKPLIPQHIVLT